MEYNAGDVVVAVVAAGAVLAVLRHLASRSLPRKKAGNTRARWLVVVGVAAVAVAVCGFAYWRMRRPPPQAEPVLRRAATNHEIKTVMKRSDWRRMTGRQLFMLGEVFQYGKYEYAVDRNRAASYYREALQKGYTEAHINLGFLCLEDNDAEAAAECFMKAAEAGHLEALLHLARIYEHGVNPTFHSTRVMALEIYEAAARTSNPAVVHEANLRLLQMQAHTEDEVFPGSRPIPFDPLFRIRQIGFGRHREQPAPTVTVTVATAQTPPTTPHARAGNGNTYGIFDGTWDQGADLRHVEMRVEDIVFNAATQRIRADSQNVHDNAVQGAAVAALDAIEATAGSKGLREQDRTLLDVLRCIEQSGVDPVQKAAATQVVNSLTDHNHSRYDRSEKETLALVWDRINQPVNADNRANMQEIMVQQLASGVEHGHVVCSTGKQMRIVSALDGMDGDGVVALRPDWAIADEIGTTVARIRKDKLAVAAPEAREAFEALEPTEVQRELASRLQGEMVTELQTKCKTDYVDTKIVSEKVMESKLKPFIEALTE